jgi:D-glycero-alpha-D-manno-heptose 1-phosphate guanylyltransferase
MGDTGHIKDSIKAVILAGGLGTRLRSVASDIPKSMMPINGRPFLEYEIIYLRQKGIKEIVLCVSHLRDSIVDYFGDGRGFGVNIEYSVEEERLGTAGAVKNAVDRLDIPDYFMVLNGDTFIEYDLKKMLAVFFKKDVEMVIAIAKNPGGDTSVLKIDDKGKVISYLEKPADLPADRTGSGYSGAGSYIVKKDTVKRWPAGHISLEYNCIPKIVGEGKAYGVTVDSKIYDIGTPEGLKEFSGFLNANKGRFTF